MRPDEDETVAPLTENLNSQDRNCIVIPTPDEKGSRKDRTGFSLLVIHGAIMSPVDLPPMARKQISWVGNLTHQSSLVLNGRGNGTNKTNVASLSSNLNSIVQDIWHDLTTKSSYDAQRDFLRIDVHPKSYNSEIITAFTNMMHPTLINLAFSCSKVSHVVSIVVHSSASLPNVTPTETSMMEMIEWGISTSKEHFEDLNGQLNDYAKKEIRLVTDNDIDLSVDGEKKDDVPLDMPVSRAYYKLAQVFEDETLLKVMAAPQQQIDDKCSTTSMTTTPLSHGKGMDIGASPGGWTQVLYNTLHIPTIIALDPAMLAERVMALPGVHHLCTDISSDECKQVLSKYVPYSVIVCDASESNANELLIKIVETLGRISSILVDKGNRNSSMATVVAWPLCLVITIKLPYKTIGSMQRNIEKTCEYIPEFLRKIASLGPVSNDNGDDQCDDYNVDIRYKICHLFANSLSERTLVATFTRK
jgi:23S rRNA U2552 (ribose-2'-O)-methylase RlmE/FtsJ